MIILASKSPRRKELLKSMGYNFQIIESNIEEKIDSNLTHDEAVAQLSKLKALDVYKKNEKSIVIGADTIISFKKEIIGKPKDEEDAFNILKKLSGNEHKVKTAVTVIYKTKIVTFVDTSIVKMKSLTEDEIETYIETKEPLDKAGAYAIQGIGNKFIEYYDGCFNSIMGLPTEKLKKILDSIK